MLNKRQKVLRVVAKRERKRIKRKEKRKNALKQHAS